MPWHLNQGDPSAALSAATKTMINLELIANYQRRLVPVSTNTVTPSNIEGKLTLMTATMMKMTLTTAAQTRAVCQASVHQNNRECRYREEHIH
jgi:hypothetical protein